MENVLQSDEMDGIIRQIWGPNLRFSIISCEIWNSLK